MLPQEVLARKLHQFYLEAVEDLPEDSYNPEARKSFDELTDNQKFIDLYIADKLLTEYLCHWCRIRATREEKDEDPEVPT